MATDQTKLCRFCKSSINSKAKVCPHCGRKQGMGCLGCAVCAIVVFFILGVIGNLADPDRGKSSIYTEENASESYISVTSGELLEEFEANQIRCKKRYNGKMLEITGPVVDMRETFGQSYVCLGKDSGFPLPNIQCMAKNDKESAKIVNLNEGQIITVRGKANVMALAFMLDNAVIVK